MQHSIVFNQVTWPGVGDVDDCWVLSGIQCVNVVAPWLPLVSATTFRRNAGDPDDGNNDGGNLNEIIRGVTGSYPTFKGRLSRLADVSWTTFLATARKGVPLSLAVISSDLPARLQYGFKSFHQISALQLPSGDVIVANPLARAQSRWVDVPSWEALRDAIMHYGNAKVGHNSAFAVAFPTDDEMLLTHPLYRPITVPDPAAHTAGFVEAKAKATAAVAAIQEG